MKRKIFIMGASTGIGKALAINYAKNVNYKIVKHSFMKMMSISHKSVKDQPKIS